MALIHGQYYLRCQECNKGGLRSMKKTLIRIGIGVVVIIVALLICIKPIKGNIPAVVPGSFVSDVTR